MNMAALGQQSMPSSG